MMIIVNAAAAAADENIYNVHRAASSSMPVGRSMAASSSGPTLSSNTYGSSVWGAGNGSVHGMYRHSQCTQSAAFNVASSVIA